MILFLAFWAVPLPVGAGSSAPKGIASPSPSPLTSIRTALKPEVYKRMLEEREIMTHARLEDTAQPPLRKYDFYAAMLVHASPRRAREVLTHYPLYAKIIPYVNRANYDPKTQVLEIEGGIWKFMLHSWVKFTEVPGAQRVRYQIIGGHFTGMTGEAIFESADEKGGDQGTVVLFNGSLVGSAWPPAFVIERGAEIVFGFAGKRMRSYIESDEDKKEDSKNDDQKTPQPRSRF